MKSDGDDVITCGSSSCATRRAANGSGDGAGSGSGSGSAAMCCVTSSSSWREPGESATSCAIASCSSRSRGSGDVASTRGSSAASTVSACAHADAGTSTGEAYAAAAWVACEFVPRIDGGSKPLTVPCGADRGGAAWRAAVGSGNPRRLLSCFLLWRQQFRPR